MNDQIDVGMPLYAFAPDTFNLKAFEECRGIDNSIFIIDNIDVPNYPKEIKVAERLLKTHYIEVWDLQAKEESVGSVVVLNPSVDISYLGKYSVAICRVVEPDISPVTEWYGDWVRVIEGDNGCLILNSCILSNAATRRLDIA